MTPYIQGLTHCPCFDSWIFPDKTTLPALFYTVGFFIEGIPVIFVALKGVFSKNLENAMEMLVAVAIVACYFSGDLSSL